LTRKIDAWIDSGYYPGASLIVVKNNRVIHKKYFGNYQPQTVAYIASAGKWLVAATIAALVDEGKLSWDDKVEKWLPRFKDIKGNATLRQLLSHTSGYPDYQPQGKHPDDYQTLAESVEHIVNLPADTTPIWRLSDAGSRPHELRWQQEKNGKNYLKKRLPGLCTWRQLILPR